MLFFFKLGFSTAGIWSKRFGVDNQIFYSKKIWSVFSTTFLGFGFWVFRIKNKTTPPLSTPTTALAYQSNVMWRSPRFLKKGYIYTIIYRPFLKISGGGISRYITQDSSVGQTFPIDESFFCPSVFQKPNSPPTNLFSVVFLSIFLKQT